MIGPLSLGDLLVIYSVVLVVYIVLTEFELMEFRRARERFNKVFGKEEIELEKEEYTLLNEIKEIKKLVGDLHGIHAAELKAAGITPKPAPAKPAAAKPPGSKAPSSLSMPKPAAAKQLPPAPPAAPPSVTPSKKVTDLKKKLFGK